MLLLHLQLMQQITQVGIFATTGDQIGQVRLHESTISISARQVEMVSIVSVSETVALRPRVPVAPAGSAAQAQALPQSLLPLASQ